MELVTETLNLIGLLLLGIGFLWKDRNAHLLRMFGWLMVGIYWLARVPDYLGHDDQFNAMGAAMALPIFSFLAFHERMSFKWHDDYPPLRFVAGSMFIAGMGYFLIKNVPFLSQAIIGIVAHQSVWVANLGGYDFSVGAMTPYSAALIGVPIEIVIECTAVQAYFIAGSFLLGCRGDIRKRLFTLSVIVPVVWVVNLLRNAMVIILVHENGYEAFDFAHNVLGKGLSLVALVLLIIAAFIMVPELYQDINGLFELPWRKGPQHDYLRFVGRLYGEADDAPGKE